MLRNTSATSASCSPVQGCPPLETRNVAKVTHTDCFTDLSVPITNLAKVPVVFGAVLAQIDVEDTVNLPIPGRALKEVRKNVHITQCRVLQTSGTAIGPHFNPKLYLAGYVHKNIQYIDASSGVVRDHEVNVPFECTIRLTGIGNPDVGFSDKNVFNHQFIELAPSGTDENRCVTGGRTCEFFNEPFECELVFATTNEVDLLENFDRFGRFNTIREKLDVQVFLLLTQKRLVAAAPAAGIGGLGGLPADVLGIIRPILAQCGITI